MVQKFVSNSPSVGKPVGALKLTRKVRNQEQRACGYDSQLTTKLSVDLKSRGWLEKLRDQLQ